MRGDAANGGDRRSTISAVLVRIHLSSLRDLRDEDVASSD